MAQFRGVVKGRRGRETTRLGDKSSGINVFAQSWQGAVQVNMFHLNGQDRVEVWAIPHNGQGATRLLHRGVVGE